MTILKSTLSAYWHSYDFASRLPRAEFLGFALFVLVVFALSRSFLGTVAIGLAVTALPIPAALVRRGRDAGVRPTVTLVLLFAPMGVGMAMTALDALSRALTGTGIPPQVFGWLLRLSAAIGWALLLLIVLAPARDAPRRKRPQPAAPPSRPMPSPAQTASHSDPVAQTEQAQAEVHDLADHVARAMGVTLQPPSGRRPDAEAAKAALAPVIEVIAPKIAAYANGIRRPPFDAMEHDLRRAFLAAGWQPFAPAVPTALQANFEVIRALLRHRRAPYPPMAQVTRDNIQQALQTELDKEIARTAPKPDATPEPSEWFTLPDHPGVMGRVQRFRPTYSHDILRLELMLDAPLARHAWGLSWRPEIYMAFPEEFLRTAHASIFVEGMLRGYAPVGGRDGLSTEYMLARPGINLRTLMTERALPCPELFLQFEMCDVMR